MLSIFCSYTQFSHLTIVIYLLIYLSIHLYISGVLLYCFCLSLVSIDRLAKNRIFFSLFSKDSTLGA